MKLSTYYLLAIAIVVLNLTACGDEYFDYRNKGEPATLDSIVGVWDNSPGNTNDNSYAVIRNDSTYLRASHIGSPAEGCFIIWETAITELSEGSFLLGDASLEIFTYKDKIGLYWASRANKYDTVDDVYRRSDLMESELSFEPVCEG